MSGGGISWAICKSAPRSRQITMRVPHQSVFYRPGCPSCHPTNSVKAPKAPGIHADRYLYSDAPSSESKVERSKRRRSYTVNLPLVVRDEYGRLRPPPLQRLTDDARVGRSEQPSIAADAAVCVPALSRDADAVTDTTATGTVDAAAAAAGNVK